MLKLLSLLLTGISFAACQVTYLQNGYSPGYSGGPYNSYDNINGYIGKLKPSYQNNIFRPSIGGSRYGRPHDYYGGGVKYNKIQEYNYAYGGNYGDINNGPYVGLNNGPISSLGHTNGHIGGNYGNRYAPVGYEGYQNESPVYHQGGGHNYGPKKRYSDRVHFGYGPTILRPNPYDSYDRV